MGEKIDVLMITYNRPEYTQLALERLLETCDEDMRVWLWHNGDHEETLALVKERSTHPRVHEFVHSSDNQKLWGPTNWFWEKSDGAYVSKVDDDCLMPDDWGAKLRQVHEDVPNLGILGCFRFRPEDFVEDVAAPKIKSFGAHKIFQNCWIEGSGYLMKRECVERHGPMQEGESFTAFGIRLALNGWIHGWPMPFLYQDHMDDPRSEFSLLKSDDDLQRWLPLSALANGVDSLEVWQDQLKKSARRALESSLDPRQHSGWRQKLRHGRRRVVSLFTGRRRSF